MTLEKQPKRRCVKSFHVVLTNSTCASLSWSLLDSSSVPQFMVVQWFPQRRQNLKDYDWSQNSWVRLPYTVFPVYIHRVFLYEEYNFHLYPVFSDGEGEPVITSASRGGSTTYGMLMSISFLCTFLLVTLFFFQKPMKKLVWKDVPNPNKCSWAKGLDFKKMDSSGNPFQSLECLQALPPLLPSEDISKVSIVDKSSSGGLIHSVNTLVESEAFLDGFSFSISNLSRDELPPIDLLVDQHPGSSDSSAQSSVVYAKVHPTVQQPIHFDHKDGNGSSSCDKGIFSAINSDILLSLSSELWESGSCHSTEVKKPRHTSFSSTMKDLCKIAKQMGEGGEKEELYYLGMEHLVENEETKEEKQRDEKTKDELPGNAVLHRQDCSVLLHPLLHSEMRSVSACGFPSLYMPQCRTAPCTGQLCLTSRNQVPPLI